MSARVRAVAIHLAMAVSGTAVLGGCAAGSSHTPDESRADIAAVKNLTSDFGPTYQTTTVGPAAIDPRLLGPQALPKGLVFDPLDCAKAANQQVVPPNAKGNMAATTAEGDGLRYIVIAVETSETASLQEPPPECRRVALSGPGLRGLVEVVDAPTIDGVRTWGTHRVLQRVAGKTAQTGELFNYSATFDKFIVLVTANATVAEGKPVASVDTQRARDLLTRAVAAVRG